MVWYAADAKLVHAEGVQKRSLKFHFCLDGATEIEYARLKLTLCKMPWRFLRHAPLGFSFSKSEETSMRSLFAATFLALCAMIAFAQGDRGTITGTVTDPAGAVVANAMIEARNVATGTVYQAATTETGNYTFAELPFGTYEVSVTVPGFKKFIRQNLTVQVAQTLRVDVTLEVGSASEAVTVSAEASMLKTESGDVSTNVNVESLDQLPILGVGAAASGSSGIRNPNNVLDVIPGTYYVPNSQVKINGAPSNTQAYHVEGQDATNPGFPYAAAQVQPSVDAIQEISVQTSNFAAEYGATGGGYFNVTMRSGTNQLHGSGYDYIVNEVLNAGNPFTGPPFTNTTPGELSLAGCPAA